MSQDTVALYLHVADAHTRESNGARPFEQVALRVEEEIRQRRLVPGQKLPTERELAAHFSVSRGAVREAIKVLGARGLVQARQGSGIYVCDDRIPSISRALTLSVRPDDASVLDLLAFREPIEVLAAEIAAHRRTDADLVALHEWVRAGDEAAAAEDFAAFRLADEGFHLAVATTSVNAYVQVILGAVLHMRHIVDVRTDAAFGSVQLGAQAHADVTAAIAAGDAPAAAAAMRRDVHGYRDALRAFLAVTPAHEKE